MGLRFFCGVLADERAVARPRVSIPQGHRHLGHYHPDRLGIRDHQLCVVDRHRPRRNADLGDSVFAPAELAELDQPVCGSDDVVRGGLRRHLPAGSHGASVAGLLDVSLSEHDGVLAAVPQPADLGRLRGLDLLHHFAGVLVRRPDSRSRDAARSRGTSLDPGHLRHPRHGMARLGPPLASL